MKTMTIAAAIVALAGTSYASSAPAPADHVVRVEIRDGDRLVAKQALRVREGVPAAIRTLGKDSYTLRIRIDPAQGKGGDYLLRYTLHLPDGKGGWKLVASPWMLVASGSEGRLSVATRGIPGYRFTLSVN
jgi:hypothetical protein